MEEHDKADQGSTVNDDVNLGGTGGEICMKNRTRQRWEKAEQTEVGGTEADLGKGNMSRHSLVEKKQSELEETG